MELNKLKRVLELVDCEHQGCCAAAAAAAAAAVPFFTRAGTYHTYVLRDCQRFRYSRLAESNHQRSPPFICTCDGMWRGIMFDDRILQENITRVA